MQVLTTQTGKYFKVVDSDDWVDEEALYKILADVLKKFEEEEKQVDMLLANYVYEKEGAEHKKVIAVPECASAGRDFWLE